MMGFGLAILWNLLAQEKAIIICETVFLETVRAKGVK